MFGKYQYLSLAKTGFRDTEGYSDGLGPLLTFNFWVIYTTLFWE